MATYYNDTTLLWLDGKLVKAQDAKMDLYSQSIHYGYSVFEGIRSYRTDAGVTKIFKPTEHFLRLAASAEAMNMPLKWSTHELIAATYEVIEKNNLQDAYIRPLVYAPANMSFAKNTISFVAIEAWAMEPFLGDKLLRVATSSFQRPNPKGFKIHAKAGGHYVNSILASQEAKTNGFDEALLTDMNDFVAEGPGANVFFEKDNQLATPSLGNILPGITRATVLELCNELGIAASERSITVEEAKNVDAAFFCGTAAEIIGWKSLDEYEYPLVWAQSLSRKIQLAYLDRVKEKIAEPVLEA